MNSLPIRRVCGAAGPGMAMRMPAIRWRSMLPVVVSATATGALSCSHGIGGPAVMPQRFGCVACSGTVKASGPPGGRPTVASSVPPALSMIRICTVTGQAIAFCRCIRISPALLQFHPPGPASSWSAGSPDGRKRTGTKPSPSAGAISTWSATTCTAASADARSAINCARAAGTHPASSDSEIIKVDAGAAARADQPRAKNSCLRLLIRPWRFPRLRSIR
jgi:hypothetical protein